MKVLVTGVSGRFGPHLVRDLERTGHEVVLFSRREPSDEFRHLQCIRGDVNSFDDCLAAMKGGIEAVHHAAAKPGPTDMPNSKSVDTPEFELTMKTNIMGLYYMLQAALRRDVGIFVLTGSNCALGHGFRISGNPFPVSYLPIDENHPCYPEDSYSFSKLTGEGLLASYTRAYGIRTYALRSAGICDEDRRRTMAANVAPVTAWSDWMWPWIGSEDLASAHRLLMEKADDNEAHGVYFCNNDDSTVLEPSMDLVERFRPELVEHTRRLEGNQTLMSNQRLKDAVGWRPETSWREYLD